MPPPSPVRAGLAHAARLVVLLTVVALVVAGAWVVVAGGELVQRFGVVLMLLGGAVALTGGTDVSRHMTLDARAFMGAGPDREVPSSGEHLTAVGVLLFVAAPLFVVGGFLAT